MTLIPNIILQIKSLHNELHFKIIIRQHNNELQILIGIEVIDLLAQTLSKTQAKDISLIKTFQDCR